MESLLFIGIANALAAVLLAAVAFGVDRTLRRPSVSHCVWLLVLLKLATPPLLRVPWPTAAAPPAIRPITPAVISVSTEPTGAVGDGPAGKPVLVESRPLAAAADEREWHVSVEAVAGGVWLTGSLLWWAVAAVRAVRFGRLLRRAPQAPADVCERVRTLAGRIGLRRCPNVVLVPGVVSPLVWAPGASAWLLVPADLWPCLNAEQRDSLLVHELAHLRRRDHWVRRLEFVVLGLYWWHPVAWLARRELQEAEERCCDGWVARTLPGSAAAYAAALVETVAFLSVARSAVPLGASGGAARDLKERVTMILQERTARPLGWLALVGVLGVGSVALLLGPGNAEPPATSDGRVATPVPVAVAASSREPARESRPAVDAEAAQTLREEIELLEAQLAVKQAQAAVAKAALEAATEALRRANSQDKEEQGTAAVRACERELTVRAAELREPQVRLKQARRRLATLEAPADAKPAMRRPDPDRFDKMEKNLDEIRREIESLRKEMRRESRNGPPAGDGPANASTAYIRTRSFAFPVRLSAEGAARAKEVILLSSDDEGRFWKTAARFAAGTRQQVPFEASHDGRYWFHVCIVDADGNRTPARPDPDSTFFVTIDSVKPEVHLSINTAGGVPTVHWQIEERNPDWLTFVLEQRRNGEWEAVGVPPAADGHCNLGPGATAVRLRLRDRAGNEGEALRDL